MLSWPQIEFTKQVQGYTLAGFYRNLGGWIFAILTKICIPWLKKYCFYFKVCNVMLFHVKMSNVWFVNVKSVELGNLITTVTRRFQRPRGTRSPVRVLIVRSIIYCRTAWSPNPMDCVRSSSLFQRVPNDVRLAVASGPRMGAYCCSASLWSRWGHREQSNIPEVSTSVGHSVWVHHTVPLQTVDSRWYYNHTLIGLNFYWFSFGTVFRNTLSFLKALVLTIICLLFFFFIVCIYRPLALPHCYLYL